MAGQGELVRDRRVQPSHQGTASSAHRLPVSPGCLSLQTVASAARFYCAERNPVNQIIVTKVLITFNKCMSPI